MEASLLQNNAERFRFNYPKEMTDARSFPLDNFGLAKGQKAIFYIPCEIWSKASFLGVVSILHNSYQHASVNPPPHPLPVIESHCLPVSIKITTLVSRPQHTHSRTRAIDARESHSAKSSTPQEAGISLYFVRIP